jgi:SNF2 family DNA or RNA helicase
VESQHSVVTQSSAHCASSKPAWSPHPYQKRAIQLLLSQASCGLFLDPGLGKTSTVLATLKILKGKGLLKRTLIVAPLRVMQKTWPDEISKWADFQDLTWTILHGPKKATLIQECTDIHLINPEGLAWLFAQKTILPYEILIIDESSKALKNFLPRFRRRWILTGTPTPNGLTDLFGQIYILDLGRALGRFITHYRKDFFDQSGYGGYTWTPKPDAFPRIVERISPLILQMSAEDYLSMPELIYTERSVQLPDKAMKIYKDIEGEFISQMEDPDRPIVAGSAAVAGVKCRQVANGAVYDEYGLVHEIHDAKLEALEEFIEELAGAPALILYEFDHDRSRIQKRFGDGIPVLGSGVGEKRLSTIIDRFNRGELPMLLGHPASMGHGLNLQGSCRHVIWFGIPWNLEYYDQAIARVYRQGQKADCVMVYHISAQNTLDEEVLKALTSKDRTQQSLLKALSTYVHDR